MSEPFVFTRGAHKGEPVTEVPTEYLVRLADAMGERTPEPVQAELTRREVPGWH